MRSNCEAQIKMVLDTEAYKSGAEWSISDMHFKVRIKCKDRLNFVLLEMLSRGLLTKTKARGGPARYTKPPSKIMRERWASEGAETLCAGDTFGVLAGEAARYAYYGPRASQRISQKACGVGL